MYVDFKHLPDDARIWIYQANRPLDESEIHKIAEQLKSFTANWKAHGADLRASFLIKYSQFIIIAADEKYNGASGCSIDASVHVIQELEKELGVNLTNKMNIAFKDGDNINTVSLKQFKDFAKADKINNKTVVFNNMVTSKGQFETTWEVVASDSWHARYLNEYN